MIDLAALFQAAGAEHSTAALSGFPVSGNLRPEQQVIEDKGISGVSGLSEFPDEIEQPSEARARARKRASERARGPYVGDPESPETPEKLTPAGRCLSGSLSLNPEKERETGNPPALPAPFSGITPPTFDERAAFLEYECGLSRTAAEAQARSEIRQAETELLVPTPSASLPPLPTVDGLAFWRAGLARLRPAERPCPDYRADEWSGVYARALDFLDQFGAQAEALGWTAQWLFGVHPQIGTVRVDHCGALVLPVGGPVRAITANEIRFGHLTHRQKPRPLEGVLIWEFGR